MAEQLKGEVYYLFAFDVADEIRTEGIQKILAQKVHPYTLQRDHTLPRAIRFYQPLTIDPQRDWRIRGVTAKPVVRIYDVGVVSIMISVPFAVGEIKELMPYHQPILDDRSSLDQAALSLCTEVVKNLQASIVRGASTVELPEAYTVFSFHQIEEGKTVEEWTQLRRAEIAGLLAETEAKVLSEQQVDETFRYLITFSHYETTIIEWDAAVVVDLEGSTQDMIHVLELANLQLEELVLMDRRVDRTLDIAYEQLEKKRSSLRGLPRKDLARLRRFRMDVAKITDEVSNISKFFGDWYLARIYMAARDRFHLTTWKESIHQRLLHLDNLYEIFRSEVTEARMLLLEVMIVLLFIMDLILVFFWR